MRRSGCGGVGVGEDPASLFGAELSNSFPEGAVLGAKDGGRKKGGIDRAGSADGESADRDAPRHLGDGEERIEAFEGF